jgi:N-acetylglucosaminyldiphosphoundecaprenol N-acetyl-beta-D-mannosaminyltransferase
MRHNILKTPVDIEPDYLAKVVGFIDRKITAHVITINAEMIMLGRKSTDFFNILANSTLNVPDGIGVVYALKLFGINVKRQPGIELVESVFKYYNDRNKVLKVAVIGGKADVLNAAVENMKAKYMSIDFCLIQNGYCSKEEEGVFVKELTVLKPSLILVALGVPRQEEWIVERISDSNLSPATYIGIGGSLDIWSNVKKRAPYLFREFGFEWLYRLYQEPHRIKRMAVLPIFALLSVKSKFDKDS